jgi:hypothetical protein
MTPYSIIPDTSPNQNQHEDFVDGGDRFFQRDGYGACDESYLTKLNCGSMVAHTGDNYDYWENGEAPNLLLCRTKLTIPPNRFFVCM